jgi:CDP-6-deoxy-D-xylo-4-hexulose-3-dehydrase
MQFKTEADAVMYNAMLNDGIIKSSFPLCSPTWGEEERAAAIEVINSGKYTMGEKTSQFEKEYASYVNSKYCIAVNSGSSANLLMIAALSLRQGVGEVIVPAIAWSTSYAPFVQTGWKLKFVDIDRETLNYDIEALKKAYQGHELILAVNLLGNPNQFAEFPTMDILEDNCESMGAEYAGMKTGNFGVMASHSTFFSHHMCTMEGGMITTDDEFYYEMLLCLRSHGWTRHLPKDNKHGIEPKQFEFIYPGYNLRPTEIQCAVGIKQIEKLPSFILQRQANAERWLEICQKKGWVTQKVVEHGKSSWFGFPIISENIEAIKEQFKENNIEYRPIMSGTFTRSKSISHYDYTIHDELKNADYVTDNGIFIGNHHYPIDWGFLN